ncbi:hypothetical protein [Saccharothrix coeruleofusca]|uniref:hypothetical protein n=1 Tax=Saccharothrix coeruleofusca TaxID=33919 RepID=UPI0016702B69|nr:hypothetical protein [Saccharothrix coeruleofusca]
MIQITRSDTRNATTSAMSSGLPTRPGGTASDASPSGMPAAPMPCEPNCVI